MKPIVKYALIAAPVLAFGIQLIPVERTNPPVVADFDGPVEVAQILRGSCYDCHSNETSWPWYSYVAPVSWLVAHDVEEARDELNFSDWPQFAHDDHVVKKISEEVTEGEMPLPIYLITHPEAKISPEKLATLKNYFASLAGGLKAGD